MSEDGILMFIGLVFVAVFLLAQGLVVPVFGESRVAGKRLKQRLKQIEREEDQGIASLLRQKSLNNLSPIERRLESLAWMESLSAYIAQSGKQILAYRLALLSIVLSIVAGFLVWELSRSLELSLLLAAVGFAFPYFNIASARRHRFAKFEEQLPDAIDVMQRALKAGHPFNSALKLVAEDMDQPIAREFELTFSDMNYGNDVRRAMLGLLQRVPSVTVMALVTSVLVQKETGGNLAEILAQISKVIRSRFQLQRKVLTLSAEGRMSAWVLAMVPICLIVAITMVDPNYLPLLWDEPFGQKLLMFAVVWGAIGVYFIRRILRIDV